MIASNQAPLNGILNTNSLSNQVAPKDNMIPESEAKLPKKKYSKVLILLTIAELAPRVLSKILSRIR